VVELINFYLIPGIVLGCIYALGAIGLSLVFGILRFAHFAHGDLLTLGAYFALTFATTLAVPPLWALPVAVVLTAAAALFVDRLFYRPLRASHSVATVIASFGVALMIRAVIQLFWGPQDQVFETGIRPPVVIGPFRLAERHLYIVPAAAAIIALMHVFLAHTRAGKAMRAMSDEPSLARVSGINTERVVAWTWVLAAALLAAGGLFLGIDTQVKPQMGFNLILPMFAAAILGGIGKPYGAIAGGLVVGLAEEMATVPIGGVSLVPPAYKSAVAFVILVAMLLWRPTGLFRGRVL
jgi:branched-subunit amino acid ABC-type transport system permease component